VHAGRSAKSGHNQTRIVGENNLVRESAVMQSFSGTVLGKRSCGLFKRRKVAKIRE
jgi:hypothetical protein